ncbi:ATP synthase F1 subunit gamma [Sediminibacterium sp.]|uniref:ATP synthase F1 subunit gamma n=1 Tax=Sediminibacterium sp. TaxID=1917865 RepID=UPI002726010B|nr:ATP synthase F1 subunit gamma [Sediminibacterium sp.]MDO9000315.1 ATP synthase F1 subunit gamma [Bacteroidota bacterium]MDP3147116.1 ATP synthase F1 subunit gamma [Bacteroidota bacterium]MDP3567355.1 ATP synthase F1 subunit gamma [Sediminibacterium sp.]
MPSLKEVRNRIVSVGSTMQITSAMKMVSAAKLKRAQDAITQMRPYANKLKELLENVSASVDASENVYARNTGGKNLLIIPISSNRGLAGAFNSNIIKKTHQLISNEYAGYNVTVLSIGKKVQDAFKRTSYNTHGTDLPAHASNLFEKLSFANTSVAAEKIMEAFLTKQFDKVVLVYNQFRNAAVQIPTEEQLLPLIPTKSETKTSNADYIFEPNQESIINELIPRSVKTQFYKALLDSVASEHGARMTAMHKATDNAQAMQKELKITYNKARQAAITKEILEIVGGAEALNG